MSFIVGPRSRFLFVLEIFRVVSLERTGPMENDHVRIEIAAGLAYEANVLGPINIKSETSRLWQCILVLYLPFHLLYLCLLAIPISLRLALANADRVIFVFATSILSFYQVPKLVFYVYIAVLIVTGFVQFLRFDSAIRVGFLNFLGVITREKANHFFRKFTSLHFSHPYTRGLEASNTIFMPVGHKVPRYSRIKVFEFPISTNLSFQKKVGDCMTTIKTVEGSSVVRILEVEAPWGDRGVTFSMSDENLGRFISYLDHVVATKCQQVICTYSCYLHHPRALSIVETIEHFDRGLSLVKLRLLGDDGVYYIF